MAIIDSTRHGEKITLDDVPTGRHQDFIDETAEILNYVQNPQTTTTALLDIKDSVNTTLKFFYKFNVTTGKPVWPSGSAASDIWKEADGVATFTPI